MTVTSLVRSQVEAASLGLDLLDKSNRHIIKLRGCLDKIEQYVHVLNPMGALSTAADLLCVSLQAVQ